MDRPNQHNLLIEESSGGSMLFMRCARTLRTQTLLYSLLLSSFACLMVWMVYVQFSALPGHVLKPLITIDESFDAASRSFEGVDAAFRNISISQANRDKEGVDHVSLFSHLNLKASRDTETIPSVNLLPIIDFQDLGINKKKVMLLIIVTTAPQRVERRQAIRGTWWKHCTGETVKCVFMTDGFITDYVQRNKTIAERNIHKDMELQPLQGGWEFGLRFLYHIRWAVAKFDFQYVLRIDDDYFLCLKRLLAELPWRPKDHLVWGNFHCDSGMTWIDESFLLFSQNIIKQFLSQNESSMLCHAHADQQIAIWLQEIAQKQYFHDGRLHHDPPASFLPQFKNATNVCNTYIGLHGTYANTMWEFGKNANDSAKDVNTIPPFSNYCRFTTFDYRKIFPPYRFDPKPCKDNPSWNMERKMFVGRENH